MLFLPHPDPDPRGRSARKNALGSYSPGRKEPGHEKWPKGAARLQPREHCLGGRGEAGRPGKPLSAWP